MTTLTFEPGAVVGGRYRLESRLGQGGMGAVWRAQHVTLKSPVAVKFINPNIANSETVLSRFLLEAQSAAALRSTHIVQVFDFGVEAGVPYIAMELLPGQSLAERLDRDQRIPLEETAHIMVDVARAVALAHESGVIHRDLKPDNIFLVEEKGVQLAKVLDFGVAKVTGGALELTTGGGTRTGAILGTPFYVSPEQGRGTEQLDHRSDLWALGVITYECVVGALPFDSQGLGDLLMKICGQPHPKASERVAVPAAFDEWLDKALAKDPDQRFQGALPMFEQLSRIALGETLGNRMNARSSARSSAKDALGPTLPLGQKAQTPTPGPTTTGATWTDAEDAAQPPMKKLSPWVLGAGAVLTVAGLAAWWASTGAEESPTDNQAAAEQMPGTEQNAASTSQGAPHSDDGTASAQHPAGDGDEAYESGTSPTTGPRQAYPPQPTRSSAEPASTTGKLSATGTVGTMRATDKTSTTGGVSSPSTSGAASSSGASAAQPTRFEEQTPPTAATRASSPSAAATPTLPQRTEPTTRRTSDEARDEPAPAPQPAPKPALSREELARELMRSYD